MILTPYADKVCDTFTFLDESGNELDFTAGQRSIMECILTHHAPNGSRRVQVETTTQYGKSKVVGAAIAVMCGVKGDKWALVAGTTAKARIIMDAVVKSALQDPFLRLRLNIKDLDKLDRMEHEQSKLRVTFDGGGEVRVFSADSRNKQQSGDALMGFGGRNIVEDESALIDDEMHAKAMRMLGGHGEKAFMMKIGNPFRRNHFLTSFKDPRWFKIMIDYRQAVEEGRLMQSFVDEMRDTIPADLFDIFYNVKFPEQDTMAEGGWMPLLTDENIESAFVKNGQGFGDKRLGGDVAGTGRNYSAMTVRWANYAKLIYKKHEPDTMKFATSVVEAKRNYGIRAADIYLDKVGIGKGAYDRVNELVTNNFSNAERIIGVNAGEEPNDKSRFANLRAEMYWRIREWILGGGMLEEHKDWFQLTEIKYRIVTRGGQEVIEIMPKIMMLREGIESPDVADTLSFTFARNPQVSATAQISGPKNNVHKTMTIDPY